MGVSCKRTVDVDPLKQSFNVEQAKEWYYGDFKKSDDYKTLNNNSVFLTSHEGSNLLSNHVAAAPNSKKYPKWSLGESYVKEGLEIVEMPLLYDKTVVLLPGTENTDLNAKKRIANASLNKVVFIKDAGGKINVRLVTIVPTLEYAASKGYDISGNSCKNLDSNFSGYIMSRKWDETTVAILKVSNGKKYQKRSFTRNSNQPVNSGKSAASNSAQNSAANGTGECLIWVPKVYKVCVVVAEGDEPEPECEEWGEAESPTQGTFEVNPDCLGDFPDTGEEIEPNPCTLYQIGCDDTGGEEDESACETAEAEYRAKFDSYHSTVPEMITEINAPTGSAGTAPVVGRIAWTVVEASARNWRVEAFSDYEYIKTSYMVILPNGGITMQPEYDITRFVSFGSHYVGSNVLFESIWTPIGNPLTQILYNRSPNAYVTSRISGSLSHRSRTAFVVASCGLSLFLDITVTIPGNEIRFRPN
ncbi:MAG: hypothetical protein EAZ47_07935 [Bacteroidetes bacterium]|nr:MAG: hypothetical protein EAZ47_07935 [Bacteroidota bacterium]